MRASHPRIFAVLSAGAGRARWRAAYGSICAADPARADGGAATAEHAHARPHAHAWADGGLDGGTNGGGAQPPRDALDASDGARCLSCPSGRPSNGAGRESLAESHIRGTASAPPTQMALATLTARKRRKEGNL